MVSIYIIHNGEHDQPVRYIPDEGVLGDYGTNGDWEYGDGENFGEVKRDGTFQVKEEQPSGSAGDIANFLFLFPVGWV